MYAAVSPKLNSVPVLVRVKVGLVALEVFTRARRALAAISTSIIGIVQYDLVSSKIVWLKVWSSPK